MKQLSAAASSEPVCEGKSSLTARMTGGDASIIEALAPAWRELCQSGERFEPFYRPEWVTSYLHAFAPEAKLLLLSVHAGAQLRGVLPLMQKPGLFYGVPARMLKSPTNVHSCRFDLVHGKSDALAVIAEMWTALKNIDSWDVICLEDVPAGGSAETLLELASQDGWETATWPTIDSPYILTDGICDPLLHASSTHFSANLRRRLRKASSRWTIELCRDEAGTDELIDAFYSLESSGWKGRQGTAIACSEATRRFYDGVVRAAARFGYLSLYLLRFGETPVAGHLGLFCQRRYFTPKVAYDERYSEFSPGHLLVEAVLRDGIGRGMEVFDFVGPSMPWKLEWTARTRSHSHCYIFRKSARGHLLSATFQLATHLRPTVRRVRSVLKKGRDG